MYPFMTLSDETEIVHSEMRPNNTVKVYFERPDEKDGFHFATCYLPAYKWDNINGFTDEEILHLQKFLKSTAHLIIEFSQKGGFANTSNF